MTELAYIYDPIAYEANAAREEARIRESKQSGGNQGDSAEETDLEMAQRLAKEGLALIAVKIGEAAAASTLSIVQNRHSNGHNKTLPNFYS